MIKEAYVSPEIAKLLEEKGFNIPCWCYYHKEKLEHYFREVCNKEWGTSGNISASTQQMAMRWLREVHNIDIVVEISDTSANPRKYYTIIWDKEQKSYILELFNSYEEAVEAVIKYCLEKII